MRLLIFILIVCPFLTFAKSSRDDLFDMDLEALMKIEVSVASKRLEDASQAPGVINVITAEEIKAYGGQRLFDILDRVPGVHMYGSSGFPGNTTAIRGQANNGVDTHVLMLMNNRPLRTGFNGGDNRNVLSSFPVDMIERIEVIRGPGSVLYGTNAFSGVVNIVTKKAKENFQGNVSGGHGTFDTKASGLSLAGKNDDGDLNYHVSGNYYDSDGWDFEVFDKNGTFGSENFFNRGHGIAGNLEYKGLKLNIFRGEHFDPTFGSSVTFPLNRFSTKTTYIDLGYEHEVTKNWSASLNVGHSAYDNKFETTVNGVTEDILLEATVKGKLSEELYLIFGGTANQLNGEERGLFPYQYNSKRHSGYFQVDYTPFDWLKFVTGVQLNKVTGIDLDLSPRFGTIARFNKNWGSKLLYGKAFRDAYPTEQFIDITGLIVGNSNLKPETIQTIDWQVYYQSNKYYGALTLFRSWQRNTIDIVGTTYENSTGVDSYGFELEGQAQLSSTLALQGSFSLQENKDEEGTSDIYENPNILFKIGANYHSKRGCSLGVFNTYIGPTNVSSSRTILLNPDADGYHWLTANLTLDLNTLLDLHQWPSTLVSIYGGNLLDEDPYGPNDVIATLNTSLIRASRYVFVSAKVSF